MKLYGVFDPEGKWYSSFNTIRSDWEALERNFQYASARQLRERGWRVVEGKFVENKTKKGKKK